MNGRFSGQLDSLDTCTNTTHTRARIQANTGMGPNPPTLHGRESHESTPLPLPSIAANISNRSRANEHTCRTVETRPDDSSGNGRSRSIRRDLSGDSWKTWRSVLSAAFALPMTEDQAETFKRLAGGREPPAKRVSEFHVTAGPPKRKDADSGRDSCAANWSDSSRPKKEAPHIIYPSYDRK